MAYERYYERDVEIFELDWGIYGFEHPYQIDEPIETEKSLEKIRSLCNLNFPGFEVSDSKYKLPTIGVFCEKPLIMAKITHINNPAHAGRLSVETFDKEEGIDTFYNILSRIEAEKINLGGEPDEELFQLLDKAKDEGVEKMYWTLFEAAEETDVKLREMFKVYYYSNFLNLNGCDPNEAINLSGEKFRVDVRMLERILDVRGMQGFNFQ